MRLQFPQNRGPPLAVVGGGGKQEATGSSLLSVFSGGSATEELPGRCNAADLSADTCCQQFTEADISHRYPNCAANLSRPAKVSVAQRLL